MNFNTLPDIMIRNANMINEGQSKFCDVLIKNGRIAKIQSSISSINNAKEIEANGRWLLPGMIDDQVHFRDPGSPHKGCIASESAAATIGGITSYMDMPNTQPPTLDLDALQAKKNIASQTSIANYAFHFGVSADNLKTIKQLDPTLVSGVKVFMGASTGNMLVDDPKTLEFLFANVPTILLSHCESSPIISQNEKLFREKFGEDIDASCHPLIRNEECCYQSSKIAVELAKKFNTQLHVLHLTTARELALFEDKPLHEKRITAEVCIHHLHFDDRDYKQLNHLIKCNPSIKAVSDKEALIQAIANTNLLDVIGTDHAPHTWDEKQKSYFQAPAGLPLVQHALPALLELVADQKMTIENVVKKTSHQVADLFRIKERGYIREGYWADLVLIDKNPLIVAQQPNFMRCGWTPFIHQTFRHQVATTIVSGQIAWHNQQLFLNCKGHALEIDR
ncbi:dihydroorotase [Acinetobacter baylyi]|uniref:Dihydroorotase n=1 Tax=Acinetobacter baylyi TaxID=202950 RepID=A0ABU0UTH3_ACIBI|nr:dihydroorotase [Acinetobacter baylyi]MDQ1207859.1 dihydroorotase [Acinetobacter baylyi]MDR6105066.1 dihydroorotase [Acinetobacter baylyi]MDR6184726.1 dihydroorotase [Acinetobacter baylyi]